MSVAPGDKVLLPQVRFSSSSSFSFSAAAAAAAFIGSCFLVFRFFRWIGFRCISLLLIGSFYEIQFGGSALKVGEEEYSLFRDYEYVAQVKSIPLYSSSSFGCLCSVAWFLC